MPLPFTGELDDTQLDTLVQRAKDFNSAGHTLMEKAQRFIRLQQVVSMPPGTRKTAIEIRNAFIFDMTQRMTATVVRNWPWIQAVADDITQESERRASKKERHTIGALKRAELEAGTHQAPFARTTWAQMGLGMGVNKWAYRPDRWANWPERNGQSPAAYAKETQRFKMTRFPFIWRSVDPLTYFPLYGDEDKVFVAEISRRGIADLENKFGEKAIKSAMDTLIGGGYQTTPHQNQVEFQELTTLSHIYYRVGGKTIRRIKHYSPFINYYEARGITTESLTPGYDALPLSYGLLNYAPFLDTMYTIIAEAFMVTAIPTPFLKPDPLNPAYAQILGADGRPISTMDISLGQINLVGGDLTLPLSQVLAPSVAESVKLLAGLADSMNLPAALRGQGIGSDWSGYLANTVLHTVMTLLSGPLRSHENAMAQMIRDYWWTIQNRCGEVWVWSGESNGRRGRWAPLAEDDIRDFYEVFVHMRPSLPRDEAQRAQTGLSLWQQGAIDQWTFLTKWLEEDFPDEVIERCMLERLFKREEVDTIRLMELMRRLAPGSSVIEEVMAGMGGQGQQALPPGFPGAQPGQQEAGLFAPGAIGGGMPGGAGAVPYVGGRPALPPGMPQALPSGPQMMP